MTENDPEYQSQVDRIEALLDQIASLPDQRLREQMEELIGSLLALYGEGLARLLDLTAQMPAGPALISNFGRDALVGSLLLLHGLHPDDTPTRVTRALAELGPYLSSQGASVELLSLDVGIAHLRLRAMDGCQGCAASPGALKQAVQSAVYAAAPELEDVRLEDDAPGPAPAPRLITLAPRRRTGKTEKPEQTAKGAV